MKSVNISKERGKGTKMRRREFLRFAGRLAVSFAINPYIRGIAGVMRIGEKKNSYEEAFEIGRNMRGRFTSLNSYLDLLEEDIYLRIKATKKAIAGLENLYLIPSKKIIDGFIITPLISKIKGGKRVHDDIGWIFRSYLYFNESKEEMLFEEYKMRISEELSKSFGVNARLFKMRDLSCYIEIDKEVKGEIEKAIAKHTISFLREVMVEEKGIRVIKLYTKFIENYNSAERGYYIADIRLENKKIAIFVNEEERGWIRISFYIYGEKTGWLVKKYPLEYISKDRKRIDYRKEKDFPIEVGMLGEKEKISFLIKYRGEKRGIAIPYRIRDDLFGETYQWEFTK